MIGGLIGCGAGIGLLYILSTFILSVLLSLISSIVPIIKISKVPIKDIILTSPQDSRKNKPIKILIPVLFLLISYAITLSHYGPDNNLFIGLALIFALLSLVFFIPYVINFFVKILEKLYLWTFGNIGLIASKNLRENKNLLNNIIMLAIVISILFTINTWGYNSILSSLDSYKQANFNLRISVANQDNSFLNQLSNYSGIEDVYSDYALVSSKYIKEDMNINNASVCWLCLLGYLG